VRIQSLAEFFRSQNVSYHVTEHKAPKVRVTGYLMWTTITTEAQTSVQRFSKNGFHHSWRSAAWEIHPVLKVEAIQ